MEILPLFCEIDDFFRLFEKVWRTRQVTNGKRQRNRPTGLSQAEVMTILVLYHQSGGRGITEKEAMFGNRTTARTEYFF